MPMPRPVWSALLWLVVTDLRAQDPAAFTVAPAVAILAAIDLCFGFGRHRQRYTSAPAGLALEHDLAGTTKTLQRLVNVAFTVAHIVDTTAHSN